MTGYTVTCPRCGCRLVGDPFTCKMPDCRDPLCPLDRVDGRPVGLARKDVPLQPRAPSGRRGSPPGE